jgi:hypothetical protein
MRRTAVAMTTINSSPKLFADIGTRSRRNSRPRDLSIAPRKSVAWLDRRADDPAAHVCVAQNLAAKPRRVFRIRNFVHSAMTAAILIAADIPASENF